MCLPSYETIYNSSLQSGANDNRTSVKESSSWGISSIFGVNDNRTSVKENSASKPYNEPVLNTEQAFSMIHLREVMFWLHS